MTRSTAQSPGFEAAAALAVGTLDSAFAQLQHECSAAEDLRDRTDLMYLTSMAQLAACRGRHFIGAPTTVDETLIRPAEIVSALTAAHILLISCVKGLDSFEVLQFVDEVGTLCRQMRRHDQRH